MCFWIAFKLNSDHSKLGPKKVMCVRSRYRAIAKRGLICLYIFEKLKEQAPDSFVFVTRPLPRNGGMAEDHGSPEAGQLPKAWTRGRRETEICQKVSGAKSP